MLGGLCVLFLIAVAQGFEPPECHEPGDCYFGYDAETGEKVAIAASVVEEGELYDHARSRRGSNRPSWKIPGHWPRLYVHQHGVIKNETDDETKTVLVSGTELTRPEALWRAADIVARQTKYMDPKVWAAITSHGQVLGIFGHQEKLTAYPNFKHMASRDCGGSCSGYCAKTCVSLGRKTEALAGLGGSGIAVVKEDNVLCTDFDGYRKGENILVHEFAHSIQTGHTAAQQAVWSKAYAAAKANHTWHVGSYAMSNKAEFWAESSQVWFGATKDNRAYSGGMNLCNGSGPVCQTDIEGQNFIKSKDPAIWSVLMEVYNSNDTTIQHGLTLCPPGRGVDWTYH